MPFQFLCPQGHLLQADPAHMGRAINCPTCGMLFVIPTVPTGPATGGVVQPPASIVQPVVPSPPPTSATPGRGSSVVPLPDFDSGAARPRESALPEGMFEPGATRRMFDVGPLAEEPRDDIFAGLPRGRRGGEPWLPDAEPAPEAPAEIESESVSLTDATGEPFDPRATGSRMVHLYCPQGHELITPADTMGQDVLCPHCGVQFTLRYTDTVEYKHVEQLRENTREHKLGKAWLIWSIAAGVIVLGMLVGMIIYSSRH